MVIRFAGDSGDGMQPTGDRFNSQTASFGHDLSTLANFPAEIRTPAGTLPSVSSFWLHFADHDTLTPGDAPNVLVAMGPAALKANVADLPRGPVVRTRQAKVDGIEVPDIEVDDPHGARTLVLGWGSMYGPITAAVRRLRAAGQAIAGASAPPQPFPRNLCDVLNSCERVVIPETNLGQLATLIRAKYLVDLAALPAGQDTWTVTG